MNKIYGIIYKITNTTNNKVYIGQTKTNFNRRYDCGGEGIERVYRSYLSCIKNNRSYNKHLYNAIIKYGFNNFQIDKEFDIAYSPEELDRKEIYWIMKLHTTNEKFGYNVEFGGNKNKTISEETRYKLSVAQKKRFQNDKNKEYMRKRIWTDEAIEKQRLSHLGKVAHAMTESNKFTLNESKKRTIICLNDLKVYDYMKDAIEKYNIKSAGNLTQVCKGLRNYCGENPITKEKLRWMYYDDYLKLDNK